MDLQRNRDVKNIKVPGSGCRNCETTASVIGQVATQADVSIELEKVTECAWIMTYGVMFAPGVVVDGTLVHSGWLPGPDQMPS